MSVSVAFTNASISRACAAASLPYPWGRIAIAAWPAALDPEGEVKIIWVGTMNGDVSSGRRGREHAPLQKEGLGVWRDG